MPNNWIIFVKKYAAENNITYACAIPKAAVPYRQKKDYNAAMKKDLDDRNQRAAARLEKQRKEVAAIYGGEAAYEKMNRKVQAKRGRR